MYMRNRMERKQTRNIRSNSQTINIAKCDDNADENDELIEVLLVILMMYEAERSTDEDENECCNGAALQNRFQN